MIQSTVMGFLFKSKTRMAIAFGVIIGVIFLLHQMLSSAGEPASGLELPYKINQPSALQDFKQDFFSQDLPYKADEKFQGEKYVHLDLKGAPPSVDYIKRIFPFFKKLGATGVLIEYEDMFPYNGKLENIPAYNAYNKSEIREILTSAKDSDLKVMPLVQTFGHLEFVLKLKEYRYLREVDVYPQVICPTHPQTLPFLEKMIDQMIEYHPESSHLHIGSDEVYHIGRCNRCQRVMAEKGWSKEQLFLSHVRNVTQYIRKTHPNVRPIMWDDEFRTLSEAAIEEFGVARMVDIMIWKYTPNVAEFITDEILEKYSKLFVGIWIATAFKGASGPDSLLPDVRHHLQNHRAWMELLSRWKSRMPVRGVALTGWQRYDHFATLCELLPVSIPSLAVCLRFLDGHAVDENTMTAVLQCEFPFAWSPLFGETRRSAADCDYPGSELYRLVNTLHTTLQEIKNAPRDVNRGWFTWHQSIHNFSSPAHVEESTSIIDYQRANIEYLESRLRKELLGVYDTHTVEEWLSTFVLPTWTRLIAAAEARERLMKQRSWPRRPLDRQTNDKTEIRTICDGSLSLHCALLGQ